MREIKFRAWDKDNKRMCEVVELCLFSQNATLAGDIKRLTTSYSSIELMQYIGKKDNQGIEIYEGDIVDCSTKFISHIYEVYWDDRASQFRLRINGETQFDKTYSCLIVRFGEVIGNIYENPELSEKVKKGGEK